MDTVWAEALPMELLLERTLLPHCLVGLEEEEEEVDLRKILRSQEGFRLDFLLLVFLVDGGGVGGTGFSTTGEAGGTAVSSSVQQVPEEKESCGS